MHKTSIYISTVCLLAICATGGLFLVAPAVAQEQLLAVLVLAVLAIIAELLSFLLPHAVQGSSAFIPYLSAVLIAPSWCTVAGVVLVKSLTECLRGAEPLKGVFNVAQHGLALSLAIAAYLLTGGESFLRVSPSSLLNQTVVNGLPALAAIAVAFTVNTLATTGVVAVSTGQRVSKVWRDVQLSSVGLDLLASPVIFVFSWAYVASGPFGAAVLWVPILGFRQLNKTNVELERTNQELLQLMVKSIEARDPYTSGHSRRVQKYALIIGRALKLAERDLERLGHAALLHDVGKIYDKYAPILRKPEKLTPQEWATMQEHPVDGASLVATMSRLKELVPAIRHHHENWDGSGYPDGLSGGAIPLESRIIALADTIDAMTSERPYRRPMTEAEVRTEIVKYRGRQFDPGITDRILSSVAWSQLFAPERENALATPSLTVVRKGRKEALRATS